MGIGRRRGRGGGDSEAKKEGPRRKGRGVMEGVKKGLGRKGEVKCNRYLPPTVQTAEISFLCRRTA